MIRKRISLFFILVVATTSAFAGDNDTTVAINKALANIKSKGSNVLPNMVATLDHLIKTYGIDLNVDKQKKMQIDNVTGNDRVFLRFMDESVKAPESQVKLMEGIDRITASALYCDCYELPKDFYSEINDMGYKGGYSLTHAVLALKIMEFRKCKIDTVSFKREMALLIPKLEDLIYDKKADSDLGIEALVMLYISGNADKVKPEWIATVIKAQQPNGAWGNNDHTTVLALWVLLEAQKNAKK